MPYKSTLLHVTVPPNDQVNRLFKEIEALSNRERQTLRESLENQNIFNWNENTKKPTKKLSLSSTHAQALSNREIDVLTLVAAGYSRKEIGKSLGIATNTAATHISSIYRKLNIGTIAEATRIAIENGVVASNTHHR